MNTPRHSYKKRLVGPAIISKGQPQGQRWEGSILKGKANWAYANGV